MHYRWPLFLTRRRLVRVLVLLLAVVGLHPGPAVLAKVQSLPFAFGLELVADGFGDQSKSSMRAMAAANSSSLSRRAGSAFCKTRRS